MSQTRTVVIERNHDYLYDKIYQLSSERDHARATYRANATSDRIQIVPNYPTMFSDLRHFPKNEIKISNKDPVPNFVNRHWRGFGDQARLMMQNLAKLGDTSSIMGRYLPNDSESVQVGGRDRFRYFRRPIIPYASQLPPDVVLAVSQTENIYQISEEENQQPLTKSKATQTILRDSNVQTDPYTPEYLVRPGEAPEVLTLATLTYGRGLPAGLHEVEMIDRARHRRQLEAQLPPLNDFSQSEKRRKMMDAIETEEWAIREKEIEELQMLRLEVLIKLLRQREEAYQDLSNQKLDRLWNKKQQEKEKIFYKLRLKYVKAIRQLLKNRKNLENRHTSRNIIRDYAETSSQIWAPLTRVGQFLDRNSQQFSVNSQYLSTYNGLLELEESLPSCVLNPKISVPKQHQYTNAGFKKRKYREQDKLRILHESIKQTAPAKTKEEKPLRFLQKIEKPIPRPATPTVEIPNEADEEQGISIILLQKIIRGRSIQAMMFEGKQKRKELIEELRSTNSLLSNEMQIDKEEKAKILSLQRQRILLEHREQQIDEALCGLEGESMRQMFDFLSKELLRIQEERRIHAFSMLAERERRIREAEESGLRQVEERRRREQDEIFKQAVKLNQATVEEYLNDIIDCNIDWSASEISKAEIEELAKKISDEAYESELTNTRLQQEEVVADLIHNFLIPEVHKRSLQEKVQKTQRKFLQAAHNEIFNIANEVAKIETSQGPLKDISPPEGEDRSLSESISNVDDSIIVETIQNILDKVISESTEEISHFQEQDENEVDNEILDENGLRNESKSVQENMLYEIEDKNDHIIESSKEILNSRQANITEDNDNMIELEENLTLEKTTGEKDEVIESPKEDLSSRNDSIIMDTSEFKDILSVEKAGDNDDHIIESPTEILATMVEKDDLLLNQIEDENDIEFPQEMASYRKESLTIDDNAESKGDLLSEKILDENESITEKIISLEEENITLDRNDTNLQVEETVLDDQEQDIEAEYLNDFVDDE